MAIVNGASIPHRFYDELRKIGSTTLGPEGSTSPRIDALFLQASMRTDPTGGAQADISVVVMRHQLLLDNPPGYLKDVFTTEKDLPARFSAGDSEARTDRTDCLPWRPSRFGYRSMEERSRQGGAVHVRTMNCGDG